MRLRDAADITIQSRSRLMYQSLSSNTLQRPYVGRIANGNGNLWQFAAGLKEITVGTNIANCPTCTGLPYQFSVTAGSNAIMNFKNFL